MVEVEGMEGRIHNRGEGENFVYSSWVVKEVTFGYRGEGRHEGCKGVKGYGKRGRGCRREKIEEEIGMGEASMS